MDISITLLPEHPELDEATLDPVIRQVVNTELPRLGLILARDRPDLCGACSAAIEGTLTVNMINHQ